MSLWSAIFGSEEIEQELKVPKKSLVTTVHRLSPDSSLWHRNQLPLYGRLQTVTFGFRTPLDPKGHRLLLNGIDVELSLDHSNYQRQFSFKEEGQSERLAVFKAASRSGMDLIYDRKTLDNSLNFDRIDSVSVVPRFDQRTFLEYHTIDGQNKFKGHTFHPIRTFELGLKNRTQTLTILDANTLTPLKAQLRSKDKVLNNDANGRFTFDRIDPWVLVGTEEDNHLDFEERQVSVNFSCFIKLPLLVLDEEPTGDILIEQEFWKFE